MHTALSLALSPLAAAYGAAMKARAALFNSGVLAVRRAPFPVVCVGNLSMGGTGKTPVVEAVCRILQRQGRRPAVVSRGYRRQTPPGQFVLVSDGNRVLADAARAGDEPVLLARLLPGAPVAVCADRARACAELAARSLCDVAILDDGFQHLALARDLNLVLLDATADLRAMRLIPAGTLREPVSALSRAALVIHTKAPATGGFLASNRALVGERFPALPQVEAVFAPGAPVPLDVWPGGGGYDATATPAELSVRALAFAGLGNPGPFFDSLRPAGFTDAAFLPLPDHAEYGDTQFAAIAAEAGRTGAGVLVTTAKDAVKLPPGGIPGAPPVLVLTQSVTFSPPGPLDDLLRAAVLSAP